MDFKDILAQADKVIELREAISKSEEVSMEYEKLRERIIEAAQYSHHVDYARRLSISPDTLTELMVKGLDKKLMDEKSHRTVLYQFLRSELR